MTRPLRRGFTLVELLVATAVFVIGFAAVFALFLSGMRFRKLADDTTLTATLASSLLTEVYLDSGRVTPTAGTGPAEPSRYDGDGFGAAPVAGTWDQTDLYTYTGVPGAAYRLKDTTDLTGSSFAGAPISAEMSTAIVTNVVALCPGGTVATLGELERRLHLVPPSQQPAGWSTMTDAQKVVAYEDLLVQHGIALQYKAVIIRQPHWMP